MKNMTRLIVLVAGMTLACGAAAERSDEDKARDAARKPAEVLAFLGLERGDTVVDIWAAGGWYTEVFSEAVGPDGTVYGQNPPSVLAFRDGRNDKALTQRLSGGRLANVIRIDQALADHPIEAGSVDLAFTALNLHDVDDDGGGEEVMVAFFRDAMAVLKPGGVMGVVDHVGIEGADNESLHRIEPAVAKAAAKAAGFVVEAESDLLANPGDDHSQMVFDQAIRGKTDRFILKLRKPE
jgi:predicted methyltransferase